MDARPRPVPMPSDGAPLSKGAAARRRRHNTSLFRLAVGGVVVAFGLGLAFVEVGSWFLAHTNHGAHWVAAVAIAALAAVMAVEYWRGAP